MAHQGLATDFPPNSLGAFTAALNAGADYIETDAHGTADGVAVLFHDDVVEGRKIHAFMRDELPEYIPSLDEALGVFPRARFNIDIKHDSAIHTVAQSIQKAQAEHRVLLTSFSAKRRKRTQELVSGTALSPATTELAQIFLLEALGLKTRARKKLSKFDAVQIPTSAYGINTLTPSRMSLYRSAGVSVHVWTINDPQEMKRLVQLGVDGIVTDATDVAVATV